MTPIWTPTGARTRAALSPEPATDLLRLGDGRMMRHMQPQVMEGQTFHCWVARDGLQVIASSQPTKQWGDLLRVSVSRDKTDPSWADIEAVRAAFYGDRPALILIPQDTTGGLEHTRQLWELPETWPVR